MRMTLDNDGIKVLDQKDIKALIDAAFKILERTGVVIENNEILEGLADYGGKASRDEQKIRFSKSFMEEYVAGLPRKKWEARPIKFSATVEIYHGYYLDPADDEYKDWTEERFFDYVKIAKNLKNIDSVYMLGCPFKEDVTKLQPLYEKLYCWKWGLEGGEGIWETDLCPRIYDMWQVYAGERGKDIKELYNGKIYIVSPLKLAREEAQQFMFFHKKGLYTDVGSMGSLGGTDPVTLAGGMAQQLAEGLFCSIMSSAFGGGKRFGAFNVLTVMDMLTGATQFGRPERNALNVAGSQIAKYLGVGFFGHSGLSDAKMPGNEAAFQKISSVIFTAIACGEAKIVAGLLGIDQVYSPVQLILEDEMLDALKWSCKGFEVNEETLALDVIDSVGKERNFLSTEHTLANFKNSLWQPGVFSREMFGKWKDGGMKTDITRAKERFFSILQNGNPLEPQISEATEKKLMKIINKGTLT